MTCFAGTSEMDDDKDARMTSPMNVDATPQAPSNNGPSAIATDPTQVEVKLSPEAIEGVMADEKLDTTPGLAAELRQLEPTGKFSIL